MPSFSRLSRSGLCVGAKLPYASLLLQAFHISDEQLWCSTGGRQLTEEELQGANPLMMLLRSMLPWVNAPEGPVEDASVGEDDDSSQPEIAPAQD